LVNGQGRWGFYRDGIFFPVTMNDEGKLILVPNGDLSRPSDNPMNYILRGGRWFGR
jgi:hypothetical protein